MWQIGCLPLRIKIGLCNSNSNSGWGRLGAILGQQYWVTAIPGKAPISSKVKKNNALKQIGT